ncbi:MAG: ABC transporter substrate-binding protein [Piscinibacter sp.]
MGARRQPCAAPAPGPSASRASCRASRPSSRSNDNYWDTQRAVPGSNRVILLLPMPEANTRLAALRSGQVDWIEVPPPDALAPRCASAGFNVITAAPTRMSGPGSSAAGSRTARLRDVRVRQALNYCIDRDSLVHAERHAEPAVGFSSPRDPIFGTPQNRYRLDAARGRAPAGRGGLQRAAAALASRSMHLQLRLGRRCCRCR